MYGQCDYAEADWYCVKREGHDGPHESACLSTMPERVTHNDTAERLRREAAASKETEA